jgi:hypothetical protein
VARSFESSKSIVLDSRERSDPVNLTVFGASGRTGEPLVAAALAPDGEPVDAVVSVLGQTDGSPEDLLAVAGGVLADAEAHVARVRASDRDWTVVRAPRLTDGPAAGYRHGDVDPGVAAVPRADVAAFLLECVEAELYVGEMPKIAPA